jgi:hypothetical protein
VPPSQPFNTAIAVRRIKPAKTILHALNTPAPSFLRSLLVREARRHRLWHSRSVRLR